MEGNTTIEQQLHPFAPHPALLHPEDITGTIENEQVRWAQRRWLKAVYAIQIYQVNELPSVNKALYSPYFLDALRLILYRHL